MSNIEKQDLGHPFTEKINALYNACRKSVIEEALADDDLRENECNFVLLGLIISDQYSLADKLLDACSQINFEVELVLQNISLGKNTKALRYIARKSRDDLLVVEPLRYFLPQVLQMLAAPHEDTIYVREPGCCSFPNVQQFVEWINDICKETGPVDKFHQADYDSDLRDMVRKILFNVDATDDLICGLRMLFSYNQYDLIEEVFDHYGCNLISFHGAFYGNDITHLKELLDKHPNPQIFFTDFLNDYDFYWTSIRKATPEVFNLLLDYFEQDIMQEIKGQANVAFDSGNYSLVRNLMERYPEKDFSLFITDGQQYTNSHHLSINYSEVLQKYLEMIPNADSQIILQCFRNAIIYNNDEHAIMIYQRHPICGEISDLLLIRSL